MTGRDGTGVGCDFRSCPSENQFKDFSDLNIVLSESQLWYITIPRYDIGTLYIECLVNRLIYAYSTFLLILRETSGQSNEENGMIRSKP